MNKNEIYETAKNMAVEQVLNMYCSKDDPNRTALKQLKVKLARLLYVIGKISVPC